jgi:hypothetical protein
MAKSKLVGLLLEAWNDIDRVVADPTSAEAARPHDGGSSFAWTFAHVANQVDAWLNVRFGKRPAHPLISETRFRVGGPGATDDDWQAIRVAVDEVRGLARSYLEGMSDGDLDLMVSYDGSLAPLRETGPSLCYALLRICAHTTSTSARSPPSASASASEWATTPAFWRNASSLP